MSQVTIGRAGAFTALPVIDVADLASPDPAARRAVAESLGRAARETGFFYVVGHGVAAARRDALIAAAKAFFGQGLDAKMEIFIGRSTNHRGYVPEGEEVMVGGKRDRKEALDLGRELSATDPAVMAGTPMLGPNQWPALPGFRETVEAYYDDVFALGGSLLRGFALALGLNEHFFDRHVTKPPSQLRLIHYPFDGAASDAAGLGAHTDYECFTLLLPTAPGLEVMNGDGEWIDVPLVEDAYVVNIGDMMEVWTNGAFVATSHRVRKTSEERLSFPLFFACDYNTKVAPLPELGGSDGADARYRPLSAGEHLYAQTIQSFTYLRERLARGEIAMPDGAKGLSSFGQTARQPKGADA